MVDTYLHEYIVEKERMAYRDRLFGILVFVVSHSHWAVLLHCTGDVAFIIVVNERPNERKSDTLVDLINIDDETSPSHFICISLPREGLSASQQLFGIATRRGTRPGSK